MMCTHTEMKGVSEEVYYLQACCWLNMKDNDKAYSTLKKGVIVLDQPSRDMLRLCCYVAVKINPPRFMEAVDGCSTILKYNSHDFDTVR